MAENDKTPDHETKPKAREPQTSEKDKRRKSKDDKTETVVYTDWASI